MHFWAQQFILYFRTIWWWWCGQQLSAWQGNMKPSCVQTNNNKLQTIKCKLTSLVCAGRSFNFIDCYCLGAIWSLYHRTESRGVSSVQLSTAQPALVTTYLKQLSASGQHPKFQPWIRISEKQIAIIEGFYSKTRNRRYWMFKWPNPERNSWPQWCFAQHALWQCDWAAMLTLRPLHTRHSAVSFSEGGFLPVAFL